MSYYSNPTENAALGSIHREWKRLDKVAKRIRRHRLDGTLTYPELYNACMQFGGIYSQLLIKSDRGDGLHGAVVKHFSDFYICNIHIVSPLM